MKAAALLFVVVCSASAPALADDTAESLFARGQEHFEAGRYQEAIAAFTEGYRLDPRPEFLINLAQANRALGRRSQAIAYLERFIALAPGHRLRSAAERTLAELRDEVAGPPPDAAVQPAREPAPGPAVAPPPSPPSPTLVPPAAPAVPPRQREGPRRSRAWIWIAGAAAVVLAAAAVFFVVRDDGPRVDDTIHLPPP